MTDTTVSDAPPVFGPNGMQGNLTSSQGQPPAAAPPPSQGDPSLVKLAGQMEGVQSDEASARSQEQAQMLKPQSALSAIESQHPQMGATQKTPPAPDAKEYHKHAIAFASAMAILGAVAGRFTRMPGATALSAFAGAINGWQEGNQQAYADATKKFEADSKTALENNKLVQEKYKAALEDRKINIDEQMSQIQLIATQYHDQIMYDMASSKNYTGVAQVYQKSQEAQEKATNARQALLDNHYKQTQKDESNPAWWFTPDGQDKLATLPSERQASIKQFMDIYANKSGGGAIDPVMVEQLARQDLTGDQSWKTNVGRGAQGGSMLRAVAARKAAIMADENISPQDIADREQEFKAKQAGMSSEERAVGGRAGGIAIAVNEARKTIPNVLAAAQKSAGKGLATWNAVENKWNVEKGDKDFANYAQQMNSLINIYGRVISGGGKGTVSDLEHGRQMLNPNMPLSAVQGALDGFVTEIGIAEKAPGEVRDRMRGGDSAPDSTPPAAGSVIKYDANGNRVQ